MEKAALASSRVLDALLPALSALPTIAMQALPIGWQDGVHQRRIGVAKMLARAAHRQLEVAHECSISARFVSWTVERVPPLAFVPSSGAEVYACSLHSGQKT